jgi:steroid delta-isomerase-like uncharacterized protein
MGRARDIVGQWWKTFEQGDFDALVKLVGPDVEVVMPGGLHLRGPAELRPVLEAYRNGFPEMRHEITSAIESNDAIAIELQITMPHTGVFMTAAGELPPTGKTVLLKACDVVRLAPDGSIASWHSYFDQASLMGQLGLAP